MYFDELTSDFETAPEGAQTGVLVSWIDRGVQQGRFGPCRQVATRFELPAVETENAKPCLVFQTIFNLSMRSKAFREMATALMGTNELRGSHVGNSSAKAAN